MATSDSTVIVYTNKVTTSANFDCLQDYQPVNDMTNLSNESIKWVRRSNNRNKLIFIKGLVNSYLVSVHNKEQLNQLMIDLNYNKFVNLKNYDMMVLA